MQLLLPVYPNYNCIIYVTFDSMGEKNIKMDVKVWYTRKWYYFNFGHQFNNIFMWIFKFMMEMKWLSIYMQLWK